MIQYIDQVLSEKLSRRHGIELLDGPVTEFPNAEYLIHELAHRETLGVDFVRGVSDRMGHLIRGLRGHRQDFNEAQTCAVELLTWELLGGDRQQLQPELLSYASGSLQVWDRPRFEAVVGRCMKTRRAAALAKRIVKMLKNESLTGRKN